MPLVLRVGGVLRKKPRLADVFDTPYNTPMFPDVHLALADDRWGLWLCGPNGWWVCSIGKGPWTGSESEAHKAANHWNEQARRKPCGHVPMGICYKCLAAAPTYIARRYDDSPFA
jgi:hypothetical protein